MTNKPWLEHYDPEVPEKLKYPLIPAHQILRNTAFFSPHSEAIHEPGKETYTYLDIYREAKRVANALIGYGVQKGDRVVMSLPNSRIFVSCFWGVLMSGGVAVPLNPLYTRTEIRKVLDQTQPRAFIGVGSEDVPVINQEVFEEYPDTEPDVDINPCRDLAFIQYTGGTTGEPKGCMFTHENFVSSVYGQAIWSSPTANYVPHAERRMLCTLPLSHIFGLVTLGHAAKTITPITVLPQFSVEAVVKLITQTEFSYWPCVPTMLDVVLLHPLITSGELHLGERIKAITVGGAPLYPRLSRKIRELSLNVYDGWGMTETCSRGIAPPIMGRKKTGYGLPCCGTEVRIVSPTTGLDKPVGEEGELWVKGPFIMRGYWENDEESKKVFNNGWLKTGDMACMDEDGYVKILGRYKECILHGGYSVYPQEIDNVILTYSPEFIDAITYGEPDETYGENAISVVRTVKKHDEQAVLEYCRLHLAPFKLPSRIIFTDKPLARTLAGKPLRNRMPDMLRKEGLA